MTNILFHSLNLVDTAALTASSENASFPVENIQSEQRSELFKSASTTDMNIVIAHGSPVAADSLLILPGSGIPQTPTITFARHTADSWATPDYGPAAVTHHSGIIIHRFTSNTKAFSRLRIQLSPAGIVSIGRIILCESRTPPINYSWGYRKRRVDRSDVVLSSDDQFFSNLKTHIWEYEFQFRCQTADIAVLEAFFEDVGNSRHLAISFDHDANPNTELLYGRIVGSLQYSHDASDLYTVSSILFREAT